ncbi:estradiol 17-betadehydrogenase 12-A [Colletotrichum higginsianum]|nr:estradiol 17-betadehydrogenase 12-A [Colletotrichum higginsianum]
MRDGWPKLEHRTNARGKKTKQYETDLSNKEKQVTQERVHLDTCVKENAVPLTKWFHLMSSNSVYGSA